MSHPVGTGYKQPRRRDRRRHLVLRGEVPYGRNWKDRRLPKATAPYDVENN